MRWRAGTYFGRGNPTPSGRGWIGTKPTGSGACTSDRDAGASRRFPPQYATAEAAREALLHVVRREPKAFGIPDSRWSLDAIHQVCTWLKTTTRGSLARLL